jgi:hypothetical protein
MKSLEFIVEAAVEEMTDVQRQRMSMLKGKSTTKQPSAPTVKLKPSGPASQSTVMTEASPLSSVGFGKEFINSVYRLFNIAHTEIPEPMTSKPKASDLSKYVFFSRTNSGKAFAVGMGDRPRYGGGASASIIIDDEGKIKRDYISASKALAQVAKGEYYAVRFAHPWGDKVRGQQGTEYKRANPKEPGWQQESDRGNTEKYMAHVEQLYGPKIRGEMNKVADFVYANLRRFGKKTGWGHGSGSDQEQVLDIANKLEAAAKEPFNTRITGSWDQPSYMEQYLQSLSKLSHGFGSIPSNYSAFADAMDTTPAGLAKFAKFILSTVRAYEERVKNMLSQEVMTPLAAESVTESDGGASCSSAIATGPVPSLFKAPVKRVKETVSQSPVPKQKKAKN